MCSARCRRERVTRLVYVSPDASDPTPWALPASRRKRRDRHHKLARAVRPHRKMAGAWRQRQDAIRRCRAFIPGSAFCGRLPSGDIRTRASDGRYGGGAVRRDHRRRGPTRVCGEVRIAAAGVGAHCGGVRVHHPTRALRAKPSLGPTAPPGAIPRAQTPWRAMQAASNRPHDRPAMRGPRAGGSRSDSGLVAPGALAHSAKADEPACDRRLACVPVTCHAADAVYQTRVSSAVRRFGVSRETG